MRHRRTNLLTRWRKQHRRRAEALAAAQVQQQAEIIAARRRILTMATMQLPTITVPAAPLLTRGQADRTRRR